MLTLVSLSVDALRLILDALSGTSLIRLWLTGSRSLHQLMVDRGALTSASLQTPYQPRSYCFKWPELVDTWRQLSSLSIIAPSRHLGSPALIWDSLSHLSSLRSLKLHFNEAEEWLMAGRTETPCGDSYVAPSGLRPLATTFLVLESLDLSSDRHFVCNHHLAHFPLSLTSLRIANSKYVDPIGCLEYLIKLPHLVELNLMDSPEEYWQLNNLNKLATLVQGEKLDIESSFWNSSQLARVSSVISPTMIPILPRTLESLRILTRGDLANYSLGHLPLLKNLELNVIGGDNSSMMPHLGDAPSLETLKVRSLNALHPNTTKLPILARTLTSISVEGLKFGVEFLEEIKQLSSLTSLTLLSSPVFDHPFSYLPAGLKKLTYWTLIPLDVPHPHLQELPSGLEELRIRTAFPATSFHFLPRSLTSLYMDATLDAQMTAQSLAGALPSSLREMNLTLHPDKHNRDASYDLFILSSGLVNCSKMVNMTLNSSLLPPEWTRILMKHLPRHLRSLSLCCSAFEEDAFAGLPNQLEKLQLKGTFHPKVTFPTEDASLLPASLTALGLVDVKITTEDLSLLPSTLKNVVVAVTDEKLQSLPSDDEPRPQLHKVPNGKNYEAAWRQITS